MKMGRTAAIALSAVAVVITPAAAALRGQCHARVPVSLPVATGALVMLGPIGSPLAP